MKLDSCAQDLANFAFRLDLDSIPAVVVERAKCHLLDTIGLSLFAASESGSIKLAEAFTGFDTSREATVFGSQARLSVANAALLNGMSAHAFDCDDTHIASTTHPSSVIVPTVLAVGEREGSSGREILAALIAGYETVGRLGTAVPEVSAFHRGYQVTTLFCGIGAAVAAAKLKGAEATIIAHAIGLAASQAGGLRQFSASHETSDAKRFHSGWPAHAGILASQVAIAGLTAPRQALEGERGLYATMLGMRPSDPARLTDGLGARWETMGLAPKAYCGVQGMQPMIEAAVALHGRTDGRKIDSVELHLSAFAVEQLCEPFAEKRNPPNAHSAVLSVPFCVALALVRGTASPADMAGGVLDDPAILRLAARTSHGLFNPSELNVSETAKGLISVRLADGSALQEPIVSYVGDVTNPMPVSGYVRKFNQNTRELAGSRRQQLIDSLMTLEKIDTGSLWHLLGDGATVT